MLIRPRPSTFAGRVSSVTTWSWRSCSSAASSIVTMRWSVGMKLLRMFRVVVLPEPVPPLTTTLRRARTQERMSCTMSGVTEP